MVQLCKSQLFEITAFYLYINCWQKNTDLVASPLAIWRNRMSYFGQKNRPIVHSIGLCPTSIFSTKHMDYTINNYYRILQRPRDTHSRLQMTPQVHHSVGWGPETHYLAASFHQHTLFVYDFFTVIDSLISIVSQLNNNVEKQAKALGGLEWWRSQNAESQHRYM